MYDTFVMVCDSCDIIFFYNQQFITWGAMADRGNYLVATVH